MNFNKIRTLTDSVTELAKALRFSTLLKLNEDETKVSRITKFRPKAQDEVDKCTIYVVRQNPDLSTYLDITFVCFINNRNTYPLMLV